MTHLNQISHVVIWRLIAYNLKLALVPCATSEWPKELRALYITLYPHAVFCLGSFANETQLSYYTKDADIIGLPLVHLVRKANSPRRLDYFGIPRTIATTSLSFERLLHLDYLTLVFVAEVTSLGGEVVLWW